VIEIGTVYGPPPTRNVGAGGEMSTCAEPKPGEVIGGAGSWPAGRSLGGVVSVVVAGGGVSPVGGVAGGVAGGVPGGVVAGGGGASTVPGTGDVPGGAVTTAPPNDVVGGYGGGVP